MLAGDSRGLVVLYPFFFFFLSLTPRVEVIQKCMSLEYEPASEPLHIFCQVVVRCPLLSDSTHPIRGGLVVRFERALKGNNALSAVLSTEGRVVGPCWEKLKPQGPKGSMAFLQNNFWCSPMLGARRT